MRDLLSRIVLDDRTPTPQFTRPQAGRVVGPVGTRLNVALELFPDTVVDCAWSAPDRHSHTEGDGVTGLNVAVTPPAGTRCLVLFAGDGIADAWVVQFDRWPS